MHTASLPSLHCDQFGQGPNLTFIHGWSAQNSVWREWIEHYFAQDYRVTLIELPGAGNSPEIPKPADLEQAWVNALYAAMPQPTHLVGWSLGGLLAQKIALQHPHTVLSLTCLASTPRFMQTEGWHWAMNPQLMNDFIQALAKDTAATLQHFWKLQIQGSDGARQLIKLFMQQMKQRKLPKITSLAQGLQLLKKMDNRTALSQWPGAVLWLLGENDPLIPKEFVTEFSTIQPQAEVCVLQGAAHMPFYSHPEATAQALTDFLQRHTA
ncbi:MAG: alpha/beta fold hydrolase [Gammaproteobacteria bacterium]|nr:alpha/beta fold hydrolase [Gammaproteobacteria bacterium]MBD3776806.1 alpha/beta fold hydrolase [Thiotrichales bacterium]